MPVVDRKRRWPTLDEIIENAKKGFIDDREAAIPPYDLEDWEVRGEPEPEEQAQTPARPHQQENA